MLNRFWGWLKEVNKKSDYTLFVDLVAGLTFGLVFGFVAGLTFGLVLGLTVGLLFGLVVCFQEEGLGVGLLSFLATMIGTGIGLALVAFPIPAIFVLAVLGITLFGKKFAGRVSKKKRDKVEEERFRKRQEIIQKISNLIGNQSLVETFFLTLDRLTGYLPEQSDAFLKAIENDVEKYAILLATSQSSQNDLLRSSASQKASALKEEFSRSFVELTETAGQILLAQMEAEANERGQEAGPDEAEVSETAKTLKDTRHYLEGLRDVELFLIPRNSLSHGAEVKALSLPKKSVEK